AEKRARIVKNDHLKASNFSKFVKTVPKSIGRSQKNLFRLSFLEEVDGLPLVIEPAGENLDICRGAVTNHELIDAKRLEYGAIRFRNFHLDSALGFRKFAQSASQGLLDYSEPSSPRTEIDDKIYTSTDYPASQWIQMHNEMSFAHHWPRKVFFF